jgi:hypothetical protein
MLSVSVVVFIKKNRRHYVRNASRIYIYISSSFLYVVISLFHPCLAWDSSRDLKYECVISVWCITGLDVGQGYLPCVDVLVMCWPKGMWRVVPNFFSSHGPVLEYKFCLHRGCTVGCVSEYLDLFFSVFLPCVEIVFGPGAIGVMPHDFYVVFCCLLAWCGIVCFVIIYDVKYRILEIKQYFLHNKQ